MLRFRGEDLREIVDLFERDQLVAEFHLVGVFGADPEEFLGAGVNAFVPTVGGRVAEDEDFLALGFDPASAELVVAVAAFRLGAVHHEIMEKVVVTGAFPDLRVHDNRAVQTGHFVL